MLILPIACSNVAVRIINGEIVQDDDPRLRQRPAARPGVAAHSRYRFLVTHNTVCLGTELRNCKYMSLHCCTNSTDRTIASSLSALRTLQRTSSCAPNARSVIARRAAARSRSHRRSRQDCAFSCSLWHTSTRCGAHLHHPASRAHTHARLESAPVCSSGLCTELTAGQKPAPAAAATMIEKAVTTCCYTCSACR
jgi:hypothetical protein